jgi:glycolate oxidase FAD binding subunit
MTVSMTDLVGLIGAAQMLPAESLRAYAVGGLTPEAVSRPESREAVSQVMRWASQTGAAVAPWGGGTRQELGNLPTRLDLVLDVSRCNRVLDFQPEDLTVTVEAGITLEALQQRLAQGGKHLAVEAPLPNRATIGGILATGATGPRRFAYGTPRDWLIGIGVVGADGNESKAGGRVVKNVTGYDLNKLYTGSLGTLGVIVEATFKLSPAPLYARALIASFRSAETAGGGPTSALAVSAAQALAKQSYSPQGVLVLNNVAAGRMAHPQIRESMADNDIGPALVVAFYEGRDEALVQRRLSGGADLLGAQGAQALSGGLAEVVHLNPEDSASLLAEATGMGWEPGSPPLLVLKLNLPPSAVGEVVSAASQPLPIGQVPGIVADTGFGTVHLIWYGDAAQDQASDQAGFSEPAILETVDKVRDIAHRAGGTAVAEWCPLAVKRRFDIWDGSAFGEREITIMRRIKEKFDPAGILNPGRFLGGI